MIRDFVATGIVRYTVQRLRLPGRRPRPRRVAAGRRGRAVRRRPGQVLGVPRLAVRQPESERREPGLVQPGRRSMRSPRRSASTRPRSTPAWPIPAKAAAVQAERTPGTALGVNGTPVDLRQRQQVQTLTTYADLAAMIRSLAGLPASPAARASRGSAASPGPSGLGRRDDGAAAGRRQPAWPCSAC